MLKNIMTTVVAVLSLQLCYASSFIKAIQTINYEVDGVVYYQVDGAVPGSDIAFYSKITGGVVLRSIRADNTGCVKITGDKKFKPALVFSVDTKDNTGNGTVARVGDREFILNDISAKNDGNNTLLTWNAAVANPGKYVFEVYRSSNNRNYALIATVVPNSQNMAQYSYFDQSSGNISYEIRVTDKNKVSYTSNPLFIGEQTDIKLYPTKTVNNINVQLNDANNEANYRIINVQGQIVQSGVLHSSLSSISVSDLVVGDYLIQIKTPDKTVVLKFIKQ